MPSSEEVIKTMTPNCQRAWNEYESRYIGGMGGGRHTAVSAFKAAWDAAFNRIINLLN